jgi:hypothetical protein
MCYFLTIASPLTLSEVRSMLPAGLTAHQVGAAEAGEFRRRLPSAQTVATLLAGACSCDLVHPRDPNPREDERLLRARYFQLRLSRDEIIRELERHRRRAATAAISDLGPLDVVAFAAEHARNAGPTLYSLRFGPGSRSPPLGEAETVTVTRTVADMRSNPDRWLPEGPVVRLVR